MHVDISVHVSYIFNKNRYFVTINQNLKLQYLLIHDPKRDSSFNKNKAQKYYLISDEILPVVIRI